MFYKRELYTFSTRLQLASKQCLGTAHLNEACNEKTKFCIYAKTEAQISFTVTAKLISAFVFATRIVQPFFYSSPKFQASSHLLRLYTARFVSDMFGNHIVGFLMTRLTYGTLMDSQVSATGLSVSREL